MGVKVTIVTWHPDAYKFGRDEVGWVSSKRFEEQDLR